MFNKNNSCFSRKVLVIVLGFLFAVSLFVGCSTRNNNTSSSLTEKSSSSAVSNTSVSDFSETSSSSSLNQSSFSNKESSSSFSSSQTNSLNSSSSSSGETGGEETVMITYADVVNRLYNEDWKSKKSTVKERTYQWSTQDPASVYNEETGEYENWDANKDWSYKVRDDKNNSVTIDLQGAGYVSRFWSAQLYRGGKITVIVDGKTVIDGDLLEYIIGKKSTDYASTGAMWDAMGTTFVSYHQYPNLSYVSSRGYNTFMPITFSKSIKILFSNDTAESEYDAASFKEISYTLFEQGVEVEGFKGFANLSNDDKIALTNANNAINFTVNDVSTNYTVNANSQKEVFIASTSGAITMVKMSMPGLNADELRLALRNTYIKAYWDGMSVPAIDVNLGDFFGSPAEVKEYKTYNVGVTANNVFYQKFYMPYKSAKFVIENKASNSVNLNIEFTSKSITEAEANDSLRFCISWQKCNDRDINDSRWPDSTTLSLNGTGRLVAQIWHTYQIYEGFWWGEGDERIFIDGEKKPSWEGTGAEDVIGYAYAIPYSWPFSTMFRAHPVGAESSGAVGDKVNVLIFGNDAGAFENSIEMSLEKYFSDDYCLLSAISYYYLDSSDIVENYKPYTIEERNACAPLSMQELNVPSLYRYEGEFVNGMTTISRGTKYEQELGIAWSGRKQLCWYDCGNGSDNAYLSFPISVKTAGKYNLSAGFTTASDFVKVDLYVDNTLIMRNVNLYSTALSTKVCNFGLYDLTAGKHVIKFVVSGVDDSWASNSTGAKFVFGLDYFDVTPENVVRLEGGDLQRLNLYTTGGEIRHETSDIAGATNGNYLTFLNTSNQNGYITFDVDFEYTGNYSIGFSFIKAFDFPIVTVYLDGNQIGNAVDLYHGGLKSTGKIDFGTMDITKGKHTFTIKTLNKNSKSAGYVFSIDYVEIVRNSYVNTIRYEVENLCPKTTVVNGGNYWHQHDAPCASSLSGGAQLVWVDNQVGSTMTIPFNVQHTGNYNLYTRFCKGGDFGIFNLYVDNVKLLSNYDGYNATVVAGEVVYLGNINLNAGVRNIKIEIVGKNDSSTAYVFGIDYIEMIYTTTEEFTRFEAENYYSSATKSSSNGELYQQNKDTIPKFASLYSNGSTLALYPASQGDYFEFDVSIGKTATYELRGVAVNALDLAKMQIYVDGVAVSNAIDCYASDEMVSDIFILGEIQLSAGVHTIKVVAVDKNSASTGYVLALDYIDFIEV